MLRLHAAAIAAVIGLSLMSLSGPIHAQALVVDGEEIADAKLMAAAKAEGGLQAYGVIQSESMADFLDAFQKDTGLKIEYVRVPTSKLYDRVIAEYSAGKLDADYADLTDVSLIEDWVKRGILGTHKVPWFDKIAPELKDKDGHWYSTVRAIQTIAVNTEMVKEADYPKSWKDTFDPKWKGKIGMQSIDAGGSAITLFAFLRLKVDPQSWNKLAALEPRTYATVAPVINDLVRGRIPMAYATASTLSEQIVNGAPIKIILPEEGMAAFGAMGNLTSTAKHPNAARLYMNYLTSKRGSSLIAKAGSYGVHPNAPPPEAAGYKFPPQEKVWNISADQWNKIHETWVDEWKTIFDRK
jgi:iron(III) transport system substrate-binding protein